MLSRHSINVFISATTNGLGSSRSLVTEVVCAQGFKAVVQEHFATPQHAIVREIQQKVFNSGGVIALVGPWYGARSAVEFEDMVLSYTQYELVYALEKRRPCLVLKTDGAGMQSDAEKQEFTDLQNAFVKRLRVRWPDLAWSRFADERGLALALAKHRWDIWLHGGQG